MIIYSKKLFMRGPKVPVIFFLAMLFSVSAFAGREDVKVVLIPVKENYFLGENVLLHFCVINKGKEKVTVNFGGDYRGAWRAHRFKVFVLTKAGDTIPDPYPAEFDFGGLSADFNIAPGDTFFHTLALNYYSRITEPGTYTVYARHDFGWDMGGAVPFAKLEMKIHMPDEKKARELVKDMFGTKKSDYGTWGKPSVAFSDFNTIRQPVYFPFLSEMADKGNIDALTGLGSIPSEKATKKIMDLLLDDDTTNTLIQAELLLARIPLPAEQSNYFYVDSAERNWKIRNGWTAQFVPDLNRIAAKLLISLADKQKEAGARMIQSWGGSEELKKLIKALNLELEKSKSNDPSVNLYPPPLSPLNSFKTCATSLLNRLSYIPVAAFSPGEDLLFILKLKADSAFRPAGWEYTYAAFFQRMLPGLTQAALEHMPVPVPVNLKGYVRAALKGKDVTAQNLACELMQVEKAEEYREELLGVVKDGENEWLLRSAMNAAWKKDFRFDAVKILVQRLEEKGVTEIVMELLKSAIVAEGSGSFPGPKSVDEAKRIKLHWQKFLAENEKEIRAGKVFHVGDVQLKKELFPSGYEWVLDDGTKWPR
jgi:hypothetical protein